MQCEICAQTCPVSCIYVWDAESVIKEDDSVEYTLKEIKVPHRTLKINAISLRTKEFIEEHGEACPIDGAIDSEDGYVYSYIDKDRCCGCGSCANLCIQGAINLKRDLGPVVIYSHIDVNQDICVACELCEDNIILNNDKCIRCKECSSRCPVGALNLVLDD